MYEEYGYEEINELDICRNYRFVEGEGPDDANAMLIGQNPGEEEDRTGRPFVGRAGRYLDALLEKHDIKRDRLYLTSVVKCKTPGNRRPTRKEINAFLPYLKTEIERINPRIIMLLGEVAWNSPRVGMIEYIESYHPMAAMRFPKIRMQFEVDLERLRKKLEG